MRLRETKNKKTKRGGRMRELSTFSLLHTGIASLFLGESGKKKKTSDKEVIR